MKTGTDNILRDLRCAAVCDVCGQDRQIAGDVRGEQATKPEEADDVRTSGDDAEHAGKPFRAE